MASVFRFYRLRLRFTTAEAVYYPPGKAGNVVRGAFGTILRENECDPDCPGARICSRRAVCGYARIFEPVASAGVADADAGPSGLQDSPRPFVLRASHLDGLTIAAGRNFHFDIHLFVTRQPPPVEAFVRAFSRLAETGLGPGRGRVRLLSAEFIGLDDLPSGQPIAISLDAPSEQVNRMRVRFATPTELKQQGRVTHRPSFSVLTARIAERITNLSELYGAGPLDWDWRRVLKEAASVRLVEIHVDREPKMTMRYSTKTGQSHGVGGFTGEAIYEGPASIAQFLPMFRAARYCGIGRHTVWGNGMIEASLVQRADSIEHHQRESRE